MVAAIRVENVGKCYRVQHAQERLPYHTLRETLSNAMRKPFRRWHQRGSEPQFDDYWALRNITFEVGHGEVVGVIGRNGAGKSTLLKLLSRITRPTEGRIEIAGKVASLLEVGTGFHPELTGRENIFLNGSILGMSRKEILGKFDDIVGFAEIAQFLDTPVKHYSSGMYVRLAFAVAAHLQPNILFVDEVLAVGDVAFQRKCLGRMHEVSKTGRTIVFVSHNMAAIEAMCSRAIMLEHGQVTKDGAARDVTREYNRAMSQSTNAQEGKASLLEGGSRAARVFQAIELKLAASSEPTSIVPVGSDVRFDLHLHCPTPIELPSIGIGIDNLLGERLLTVHTPLSHAAIPRLDQHCTVSCCIPAFPLAPGEYWLKLALSAKGKEVDCVDQAMKFTVVNGELFDEGRGHHRGVCVARSEWSSETAG